MQGLKILVISLGVLIIGALGLLGYGLYQKSTAPDTTILNSGTALPSPNTKPSWPDAHKRWQPPEPFGNVDINLPQGCSVENIVPTRGRRLFLHIGPSEPKCARIIIVDTTKGTVLGTINIKSQP